jgi:hypothetical protein
MSRNEFASIMMHNSKVKLVDNYLSNFDKTISRSKFVSDAAVEKVQNRIVEVLKRCSS